MADDNKPVKYMRYAIGEIALVVIGILIALQINNWNEQRKEKEKTMLLLGQVQKELFYNIERCNDVIDFYRGNDSLYLKVVSKKMTYDDYKSNPMDFTLLQFWELVALGNKAFTSLEENDNPFSEQLDSIFLKLKVLYIDDKISVDNWDERTSSLLLKYQEKLKNEKEWLPKYLTRTLSEADFQYFLSDPFYFNEVYQFRDYSLNHLYYINQFKIKATSLYKDISLYLNLKMDSSVVNNMNDYKHYIGTYAIDSIDHLHIVFEKNKLNINITAKNDTIQLYSEDIFPESKEDFIFFGNFGKLIFDKNDLVTGMELSTNYGKIKLKKIN